MSCLSLVVAGLLVRSFQRATSSELGFDAERIIVVSLDLKTQGYDEARAQNFQQEALRRLEELPGVVSASLTGHVPLWWEPSLRAGFASANRDSDTIREVFTTQAVVAPRYFETLGIPILEGRGFSDRDRSSTPYVAIVSKSLARRLWPDGEYQGKQIDFRGSTPGMGLRGSEDGILEVVGIVEDTKHMNVGQRRQFTIYVPLAQCFTPDVIVHIRTDTDTNSLLGSSINTIGAMEDLPFHIALPLSQVVERSLAGRRVGAILMSVFGLLTLSMTSLGIYSVVASTTSDRTPEIGVRMALGARRQQILRLIIGQGLRPVLVGVLVGLGTAAAATRLMSSMLHNVLPTDPLTYTAVAGLVGIVSVTACYAPARSASKLSPSIALRHE